MKKTLLILSLFCASSLAASAATVWYDFNADNKSKVVGGNSDALKFATGGAASTVKVGLSLTAANSITSVTRYKNTYTNLTNETLVGDWNGVTPEIWDSDLIQTTTNAPINDSWKTFIGGNQRNLAFSITISGLDAGQAYGVYVISGTPFEGAGAWNGLSISNTEKTSITGEGWKNWGTGQNLAVKTPNNLGATGVVADSDGNITLQFKSNSSGHTMAINALAITGVADAVPEPATASLGLLGLAALMLRRRRA